MAEEKITLTLNPQMTEEEPIAEPAPQLKTADQQQRNFLFKIGRAHG